MSTWNDAETVRWWLRFNRVHQRYHRANAELAKHALSGGAPRSILDVGAGTGSTTEAIRCMCPYARFVCLEPAAAMRAAGQESVTGPGIHWTGRWPRSRQFDRVLCGAGIWQMQPLATALRRLALHVAHGGALVFNIPSLYLGVAETPGGGPDPFFVNFVGRFPSNRRYVAPVPDPAASVDGIEGWLREVGLTPQRWEFRVRLTLEEYRDWWKIPVLSHHLWPDLDAAERAWRLDKLAGSNTKESWKWENWTGWTAWKN